MRIHVPNLYVTFQNKTRICLIRGPSQLCKIVLVIHT